jgi:ubiquinone/menaquinone biosynthesis C-methylase UbiE
LPDFISRIDRGFVQPNKQYISYRHLQGIVAPVKTPSRKILQTEIPVVIETEQAFSPFASDITEYEYACGIDFEYDTCLNEFIFKKAVPSGLLILNPRPAKEAISAIYPSNYEPYQFDCLPPLVKKARNLVQRRKALCIRKELSFDARILDIGCGAGSLLRVLREVGSRNWELHGNDLHKESLLSLSRVGFKVHHCDVENIPMNSYFDAIILNQVIEHMPDVRKMLDTCHRLLKLGGKIFIETPSTEGLDAKIFAKRHWGGYHFPRHFYLFNEATAQRLLVESRFKVKTIHYLSSPSFWVQSIHHNLMDRGQSRLARLFTIRNPLVMAIFTFIDLATLMLRGKTSNMRIIATKAEG